MRSMRMQGLQEARRIEAAAPAEADRAHRQQLHTRTGQQAGVQPGDVLEQRRQRQHAQMALDRAALADLRDAVRHGELRSRTQAHPLGLAGAAGGVGDLRRARGQRRQLRRRALQDPGRHRHEARKKRRTCGRRIDDQRVDAGAVEHVHLLSRREEAGQGHTDLPAGKQREIPERPLRAVVERERHAPRTHRFEHAPTLGDRLEQSSVRNLLALATKRGARPVAHKRAPQGVKGIGHGPAPRARAENSAPRPRGRGPHPGSPPPSPAGRPRSSFPTPEVPPPCGADRLDRA